MTIARSARVITVLALAGSVHAQECAWEFFNTPTITSEFHVVFEIDGISDTDVWAVGFASEPDFDNVTFAMHFDGNDWRAVPTPNPSQIFGWNVLQGVVALAPDDAIAVGVHNPDTGGASQTMAIRFDGTDWSQIDSPFITGGSWYDAIGRAGASVWAVGGQNWDAPPPAAAAIALASRWTGSGWEEHDVPPLAELGGDSFNNLYAVHGVSDDDVWAVGQANQSGSGIEFFKRSYVVHFDGSDWSNVNFPFGNDDFSSLEDVYAIASDDVWAVGYTFEGADGTEPLIAHYDGVSWTQHVLPPFPEGTAELRAVTARSSSEVYAFGTWAQSNGIPRDLILRYDGSQWTQMPGAPDKTFEWFRAAKTLPSGTIWAGGQYLEPGTGTIALAERLTCSPDGGCPADLDNDNDADADDFFAYLDLFASINDSADIDRDGDIDADDFFAYLDLFAQGC